MTIATYPVHVDATLDPGMSRWLWLVKWLLAIPHYFVLFFLWIAFAVISVLAFFAILFTGRYPSSMFEFNVGVLRWTWRVAYYTYGALGTDRYPPFTLADVADYPAHFDVDYPAHLSRGLVLVKWWLLAIPHYVVVGIFLGGGTWALWQTTDSTSGGAPGLIGVLVVIAAVVMLFTGRYPQQLFDFVLGMNRWALRVAAYAGLMTDEYPPFRLDMGGHEGVGTVTVPPLPTSPPPAGPPPTSPLVTGPLATSTLVTGPPPASPPVTGAPSTTTLVTGPPPTGPPPAGPPAPPPARRGWTAGRVVSLVIGCVLGLLSLGLLAGGGVATWATNTQRDPAGYLTSGPHTFATTSYAVTSDVIDLGSAAAGTAPRDILGTLRFRATSTDPARAVFIGIAPRSAVDAYLRGVGHMVVSDWADSGTRAVATRGVAPAPAPIAARIWTARTAGFGTQTLTWHPTGGQWMVVVMNPDASPGMSITADVGATVPDLAWIAVGLFVAGGVLLLAAVALITVPVVRASR